MGARGVIGTAVVVVVLAGGAFVADGIVRERTEARLAEDLQEQIPGLDAPPDVTIRGFPFLTQVAGGELDRVDIAADEAVLEGLALQDVVVRLTGVSTDQPTTARTAELSAVAPVDRLGEVVDLPVALTTRDGALLAEADVLGVPIEITLLPRAAGREIAIEVQEISAGGGSFDLSGLPGLDGAFDGLTIPVDQLPEGLELTDVRVEGEGVVLEAAGEDVAFEMATTSE
ncbi:hypothetical protein N866_08780 [Actinotalea ferrariae CF5-4]|uniref:DUF2993 domain-containing protein n=1 Tax=Actinotalea ferrariae CF5-4 TaxID=948458 RepID=A0A021VTN9_9CELL|nr:DUF2993 domain-containing protein [Actinotalea ferrariae]EYR64569.1 hypothetical protein N866_08780 [Actinotalea ferrariae CF5-4]